MSSLTLISLPIGNLKDITVRAQEKLTSCEWVLAEDTRNLKKILDLLEIDLKGKRIDSFHDHSSGKSDAIIAELLQGKEVCLVSDAGSPIISDPAYPLVTAAIASGVTIDSIPGVSSVIVALELSGLPPHPFCFHGFIAREKNKKEEFFNKCQSEKRTHIFFESPHRIKSTLELLSKFDFQVAATRELTKKFQSVLRYNSQDWKDVGSELTEKGEFVILIHPVNESTGVKVSGEFENLAQEVISKKAHPKSVAKLVSKILGFNTKDVYSEISR